MDVSELAEQGIAIAHRCADAAQTLADCEVQLVALLQRACDLPNDEPEAKRQLVDTARALLNEVTAACATMAMGMARKRAQ